VKHPVAAAFVAAVVITGALIFLALVVYNAQQVGWAIAMAIGAFPFIWFFAWLVTNGISWWRETTGNTPSAGPREEP
jgi:hypothetical protein